MENRDKSALSGSPIIDICSWRAGIKDRIECLQKNFAHSHSRSVTSRILQKYDFEILDPDAYKPNAKMAAMKVSKERLASWLASLEIYYNKHSVHSWKLVPDNGPAEEIRIKAEEQPDSEDCDPIVLYTVTVFVSTGTIQCQGNGFREWSSSVFPALKKLSLDILSAYQDSSRQDDDQESKPNSEESGEISTASTDGDHSLTHDHPHDDPDITLLKQRLRSQELYVVLPTTDKEQSNSNEHSVGEEGSQTGELSTQSHNSDSVSRYLIQTL